VLAASLTLAALLSPPGPPANATGPGERAAVPASTRMGAGELRRLLHELVAAGAPGAAGRLVGERDVVKAASVADAQARRPMRPGLHYRVGSVTKSFVATVVLQLVDERRLALDDTVERWLPGILPYGRQVTVRHLLSHTGGVPDYVAVPYVGLYTDPQQRLRAWTPRELVALVAGQPPRFPPGSAWSYSNTDYVLAGMIVEAARTTVRCSTTPSSTPRWRGRRVRWCPDLRDLQRFFRALLRGRLPPPSLLAAMTTPFPTGRGFGYGLGLIVIDTPTGRVLGHDGAIPGFHDVVLSTEDGRRQVGLVVNEEFASAAVSAAFDRVIATLDTRLGIAADVSRASAAASTTP
jgi:D-alanyl-D-alanine carboxypeptidase